MGHEFFSTDPVLFSIPELALTTLPIYESPTVTSKSNSILYRSFREPLNDAHSNYTQSGESNGLNSIQSQNKSNSTVSSSVKIKDECKDVSRSNLPRRM